MSRRPGLVLSVLLALVLTACGSGDDDAGPTPSSEDVAIPVGTLTGLVGSLPDIDPTSALVVQYGDVAAIAEANGVGIPADGDVDALLEWGLAGTSGVPIALPSQLQPERLADHDEYAVELGVSLWQSERYASVEAPPRRLTVLEGDIDADAITDALGSPDDDVWSAGGEELETDLDDRTVARPLGEGLRLALRGDDQVLISTTIDLLDDAVEQQESIRDDTSVADALDALEDDELVSGLLVRTPLNGDLVVNGGAFGGDADGVRGRMVFGYPDDEAAADAVADVETLFTEGSGRGAMPWSSLLTVEDVSAEGSVVVVDLSFGDDQRPQAVVQLLLAAGSDLPQAQ